MTEPECGCRVDNKHYVKVVYPLQKVVRQQDRHFDRCQKQEPNFCLVERLLCLVVALDVKGNAVVKCDGFQRHYCFKS